MRRFSMASLIIGIIGIALVALPAMAPAEMAPGKSVSPPISQPLMTEGALALQLAPALGVSSATDEVAAESDLGDAGIVPRNGWVADYPVTPDIVAEVRQTVAAAADDGTLHLKRDDALKRFDDIIAGSGLAVRPYTGAEVAANEPETCENYPNPATINSYYGSEGPPIVTYYCPPPDFYYEYDWVPYPFWCADFWFPGFFILRDFDRHVHIRGHFVHFSNHFNDVKRHRMFRIDPVDRFQGKTFAGIGVKPAGNFISTGVRHSPQTIFNTPRGAFSGNSGGVRGSFSGGAVGAPSNGARGTGGFHGGGISGGSHGGYGGGRGGSFGGSAGGGHGGSFGGGIGGGGHGGGGRR